MIPPEKKSTRTRHGNKHLKATLAEVAWAATRTKNTFFRAKYESLVGRRGKKRALIAVGHKILCATYHILKKLEPFKELGYDYLMERKKKARIESYKKQLRDLGYEVVKIEQKEQSA